jgi:4-hydroxybenzoate polyprenyltransferase
VWLPVAALLSVYPPERWPNAWRAAIALFIASYFRTLASILANDLADRSEDLAAGKSRWIVSLPRGAAASVVGGLTALGVCVLAFLGAPVAAWAAYVVALALGFLYSVRPVRFKEQGILGLAEYSLCCSVAYAAVPSAWLASEWTLPALLAAMVFLDRWVNLHFHQVVDYEADRGRQSGTYAVRVGRERARRTLQWAANLAVASIAAVMVYLALVLPPAGKGVVGVGVGVAIAAAVNAQISMRRPEGASDLVRELPSHYLGLTFAVWWVLPPLLLGRLAIGQPTLWPVAGMAALSTLSTTVQSVRYRYA